MRERTDDEAARPRRSRGALAGLATATVVVAVLHPVLELLGRNPEFFVARASPRTDALVVALLVGTLPAALVWAGVHLAERVGPTVGVATAAVVVASAGTGLGWQLTDHGPVLVGAAGAVAGATVTLLLARTPVSWSVLRWGAAVPIVSLVLFLGVLPVRTVLWSSAEIVTPVGTASRPVPVVVVVFDELPTASLLAGPDTIDAERFPRLRAFADDAVWYRNATTVTDRTSHAVPAILTGMRPSPGALPIAADHPQSLYTLLAPTHDVHAVEPVTALCPDAVCGGPGGGTAGSAPAGARSLLDDLRLVAAHVLLPDVWTAELPAIDQTWGGFADAPADGTGPGATAGDGADDAARFDLGERALGASRSDRRQDLRGVVRPAGERPPAYLLHTMLPHVPYRYLPSGQEVLPAPLPGLDEVGTWTDDAWIRGQAQRRHLLQAGIADRLLGEVLDDLRAQGLYDEAVIAVVADHGVAFRGGFDRRRVEPETLAEIAAVPLIVRYPDGPHGVVDDRPVETIDLAPTIADVLGIEVARPFDGTPLTSDTARTDARRIDAFGDDFTYATAEADPWRAAREIRRRFGEGWAGLYATVDDADLVGRAVTSIRVDAAPPMLASVDHEEVLRRSDPDSDPIVGVVTGGLAFAEPPPDHVSVAVAFDGIVVAVGRTTSLDDGDTAPYQALIAPGRYAGDLDRIDVYVIDGDRLRGPLPGPRAGGTGPPWARTPDRLR